MWSGKEMEHMHARVVRVAVDPSQLEQFVRAWEDSVLAVGKSQAGYVRSLGLYDAETKEAVSVMLFDSKEHMDAATPALRAAGASTRDFVSGAPSFGDYEVRVED